MKPSSSLFFCAYWEVWAFRCVELWCEKSFKYCSVLTTLPRSSRMSSYFLSAARPTASLPSYNHIHVQHPFKRILHDSRHGKCERTKSHPLRLHHGDGSSLTDQIRGCPKDKGRLVRNRFSPLTLVWGCPGIYNSWLSF